MGCKGTQGIKRRGLVPVGIEPTTLALLAPRSNQTELWDRSVILCCYEVIRIIDRLNYYFLFYGLKPGIYY